jgi:hypothetical protein
MILHEVIVSNHISYFKTITLSSNSLFQTMKAKHKSWFPNHEHDLPNHDHGLSNHDHGMLRIICAVYRYFYFWHKRHEQAPFPSPLNVDTDDSEGHVICHFLIIHGGSFGYKMFSMSVMRVLRQARQNAWTTTSISATPRRLRQ